jgi:hypothetical protein
MRHPVINWKNWMALLQHFGSNLAAYFVKNNWLRHAVFVWNWRHRTVRHRQQLMLGTFHDECASTD